MEFFKPNIIVSKCLNFDNCRFNGDKINDDFLNKLSKFVNFITVCPEVEIGLGTPRLPLRIYTDKNENQRLYQPGNNLDLTEKINIFSIAFLKNQENIDGFVLKNRSPSCGIGDVRIYDKIESHTFRKSGVGFFTQNINKVFPNLPKEDEGRLKNFRLREDFLTKVFCLAEFREIKKQEKISLLSDFQAKNKYLFMAFSPEKQVILGRIIASYDKTNLKEIFEHYYIELLGLFNKELTKAKFINAITHVFGYFKNNCSSEEKKFFLETLDVYREGRIPSSSVINILKIWALRDKQDYILKQSILNPYPSELIELSDSGKLLNL